MNALVAGLTGIAGGGLAWYGSRALARIRIWGEKMNECDRIFQMMEGIPAEESGILTPQHGTMAGLLPQHLPHGAAGSK